MSDGRNHIGSLTIECDVPVPMRDGTVLRADVYRPSGTGRWPVLLCRTPYNKQGPQANLSAALKFARNGYAVVIQDCRGRYRSDGSFVPFFIEIDDGYDTVEWAADQSWSNGRVGMFGMSYMGATQWLAAMAAPPHLYCIFPAFTAADYYNGWVYQGGAVRLAFIYAWTVEFLAVSELAKRGLTGEKLRLEQTRLLSTLDHLRRTLAPFPLKSIDLLKDTAPYFYEWLDHPSYDEYWRTISIKDNHHHIKVPSFNFGGWYDLFREGPVDNFVGLRKSGGSEAARKGQRLLMGPWTHNSPLITTAGQVNFGRVSAVDIDELQLSWFDYWLKETDSGIMDSPPVRLFTMGKNVWQDYEGWPLPQTQYVPLYLHSGGHANSLSGDGFLSWREPVNEPPDYYLYNPLNPVPTIGADGAYDQSPVETRQDVLVYSTEPLSEEIEITGSVTTHLFVSSSASDTDFVVKLVDVSPNGFARNIANGILRTRYRTSFMFSSSMRPGSVYSLTVDLGPTSNVFQKGHRIRAEITSSHFPRFDRNTNTGTPVALESRCVPALQTIYHDKECPSHIVLPVIMR